MTIRELLAALIRAPDLDQGIRVITLDGADLGPLCVVGASATTLVLAEPSDECAAIGLRRIVEVADGDPTTLRNARYRTHDAFEALMETK